MSQETTTPTAPPQALTQEGNADATTRTPTTVRASGASSTPSVSGMGGTGGTTHIADEVVARIAGLAAREVSGVHDMAAPGAGGAFATLTGRVTGQEQTDKGVAVEVGQTECIVDLTIVTDFGASIPQVSEALRRNVSGRVTAMTGLTTKEVNINVVDLYVPQLGQTQGQDAGQTRVQ